MSPTIHILGLTAALLAAAPAVHAQGAAVPADSGGLVATLGDDTLALEHWVWRGDELHARTLVRSPETQLRDYRLELTPAGRVERLEVRTLDPISGAGPDEPAEVLERTGDAWTRTVTRGDSTSRQRVEGSADALPFIDMVHWPLELVLRRAVREGIDAQPFLMGGRVADFRVERGTDGRVTITHPFRGPSVAEVDSAGRLLSLDASRTTRKLRVQRVPWVELEGTAERWAVADRRGRGIGELSGRDQAEATIGAAHVRVDYGTPSRRGREIFGRVVPWGTVWRTGANRATHLSTDRPLRLGDPATGVLEVPAGGYTLFTIPAEDGGVLIVNRQTGQNGTAYDPARDLGRVPMRRAPLAEPVERFTIVLDPGGALRLQWDRTEFVVPVEGR
jgi:hypothetical protein